MTRLAIALVASALAFASSEAQAQNFFERLFGITPQQAPQAPPPAAAPAGPAPSQLPPGEEGVRRAPAERAPARPLSIRAPSEENILNRDLKQNGSNGSMRLERIAGGDLRARITLAGRRAAQSVETCQIPLGGSEGVTLVSQGRPDGTPRYQLADPTCPLQIDVLDEAVLVKGPGEACVFAAASCQGDPSGLWGPEPSKLMTRIRDYEAQRASSDRVVRENYRLMAQRARPDQLRPIVAEQAAFSSEREMTCQSYAREGTTSFCNAKFTEARALALATKLGVSTLAASGGETRRRRTVDPYALPSSDEIMQRRPAEED